MITIHTPTPNPDQSIDFYHRLGFRQISETPILFTDGIALIEINPDRYARAGVKLYGERWHDHQALIELLTPVTKTSDGYLFADPSGVYVYWAEETPSIEFTPESQCFSTLGNFAGLSLETSDMQRSAVLYETLGWKVSGGSAEGGYLALDLDGFGISLMRPQTCPHLFFNPSMTYFNSGKNPEVIAKLRELDIPLTEEITHFNPEGIVDNVIIRDPGGYGCFVFND